MTWLYLPACSAGTAPVDLEQGWEYRWGDSPFSSAGVPLWTQAHSDGDWSPIGFPSNPPGRDGRTNVWYRITLPAGEWRDPVLYVFSADLIVEVYLDSRKIHAHGQFDARGKGAFAGWPWHMIALPDDSVGKTLYFRIYSDYMDIGLWGEVKIMERLDLLRDMLGNSVERVVASGFSLLIALLSLVFALLQREQRSFGALALFALSSGVMVLSDAPANLLLLDRPLLWEYLGAIGYFVIPIAMAMLLEQWLRPAANRLLNRVWKLHLLYLLGAIGLSLSGVISLASTYPVFDALFALSLTLMLIPAAKLAARGSGDQKVILAAYALLSALLLLDMAVAHGWLPWSRVPLAWGSLAFSLAVVLVSLHHYAQTQRALRDSNASLEQQVQARTTKLADMAVRETERVQILEREHHKRNELEEILSALHNCQHLRDTDRILTERLPALCQPLSGAFYGLSETGNYRLKRHWGDRRGTTPIPPTELSRTIGDLEMPTDISDWRFPITYEHPDRGQHDLGLLLLQMPDHANVHLPREQLLSWWEMIERGVEKIHLTLSLVSLRDELRALSYEDALTGLKNRRFLDESLEREIAVAQRRNTPLSLIICDIDHFKRFNDTYGHAAGDAVLERVASHLTQSFRQADIACRYGGEEFVILMPCAETEDCRRRAEDLRQRVAADRITHAGRSLGSITLSAGIASWPDMLHDPHELLTRADQALYRAKQAGRNRVEGIARD